MGVVADFFKKHPEAATTAGNIIETGGELGKDLYARHLEDTRIKPAVRRYLDTAYGNAGYSGYSKAQTESMRMARDIARGNIAKAQGETMAQNMSLGQRINAMVNANVMNTDPYNLANSLNKAETANMKNQIGIAEAKAGRDLERFNRATENLGEGADQALSLAGMPDTREEENISTPHMDPGKKSSSYDDAVNRIRNAQASDDDLRTAFKGGYKGGEKTQAEYKRLGLIGE